MNFVILQCENLTFTAPDQHSAEARAMLSTFILPVTHSDRVATTGEAHLAKEILVSPDTPLPQVIEIIERHLNERNQLVGQVNANAPATKALRHSPTRVEKILTARARSRTTPLDFLAPPGDPH